MVRQFEDSWRRIDRAIAHARVITKQWPDLFDPSATPDIVYRGGVSYVAQVRIKKADENDFALEVGEFFYQLRAALDAVAYKVVVLETGIDPPPRVDSVEFPIYIDKSRFDKCPMITLTAFPTHVHDLLDSIQPYSFPLSRDPEIVELGRRLKSLHDCARKDRHRKLHMMVAGISKLKASFVCTNMKVSNVRGIPIDFFGDDIDFLAFDATIIDPAKPTKIWLATDGTIDLGLAEFPNHVGEALGWELEKIMVGVRLVVQFFEDGYPIGGIEAHGDLSAAC